MWWEQFRLNVEHTTRFEEPVFELPKLAAEVSRSYFKTFTPRFSLAPSDIQVSEGQSYGDFAINFRLFGGAGVIRITTEELSQQYTGINTEDDLKIVKDCIGLSEQGLTHVMPNISMQMGTLAATSWLMCEGGTDAAQDLLSRHGKKSVPFSARELGADESVNHIIRAGFTSSKEGWTINFVLERSALEQAHLYYRLEAIYLKDGAYGDIEKQAEHAHSMYLKILELYELRPKGD